MSKRNSLHHFGSLATIERLSDVQAPGRFEGLAHVSNFVLEQFASGLGRLDSRAQAMAGTIRFLTGRGIPVMAHVGLTPQAVNAFGGYGVQGRGEDADRIRGDASAVAEAGAFAVVLEKVPEPLASRITEEIAVPTIGIGASPACDGQILVVDDMLGLFGDFRPKFVKRYAELGEGASAAIAVYAQEVRERRFPAAEHVFGDKPKTVSGGEAA